MTVHFTSVQEHKKQEARIAKLENAVREFAQANAWRYFGECRGYTTTGILSPHELDALAKEALTDQEA